MLKPCSLAAVLSALVMMSALAWPRGAPEPLPALEEGAGAAETANADGPLEAPDPGSSPGLHADDEPLEAPEVLPLKGEIEQLTSALRRVFERGLGDALAREITNHADDEEPAESASEPPPSGEFDAIWRSMFSSRLPLDRPEDAPDYDPILAFFINNDVHVTWLLRLDQADLRTELTFAAERVLAEDLARERDENVDAGDLIASPPPDVRNADIAIPPVTETETMLDDAAGWREPPCAEFASIWWADGLVVELPLSAALASQEFAGTAPTHDLPSKGSETSGEVLRSSPAYVELPSSMFEPYARRYWQPDSPLVRVPVALLERLAKDDWRPRTRSDLEREAQEGNLDPSFEGFGCGVSTCR